MKNQEKALAAMREFKRAVLEAAERAAEASGLDLEFDGKAEWVFWDQMSRDEREAFPETRSKGGMFRVGVEVVGFINL